MRLGAPDASGARDIACNGRAGTEDPKSASSNASLRSQPQARNVMAIVKTTPETVERLRDEFIKPLPEAPAELIKYVMVELDVRREFHVLFQQQMQSLVEIMFDLKKWELVYAAYPITGPLNRFVHIWQIPDESSIVEVMREGALGNGNVVSTAHDELTLQEEFRVCYQRVQGMIASTKHTLMTSLPYDPAHVGFQSQTILVDV